MGQKWSRKPRSFDQGSPGGDAGAHVVHLPLRLKLSDLTMLHQEIMMAVSKKRGPKMEPNMI